MILRYRRSSVNARSPCFLSFIKATVFILKDWLYSSHTCVSLLCIKRYMHTFTPGNNYLLLQISSNCLVLEYYMDLSSEIYSVSSCTSVLSHILAKVEWLLSTLAFLALPACFDSSGFWCHSTSSDPKVFTQMYKQISVASREQSKLPKEAPSTWEPCLPPPTWEPCYQTEWVN